MDYENPPVGDEVQVWFEGHPSRQLQVRADGESWVLDFARGSKGRIELDEDGLYAAQIIESEGPFRTVTISGPWAAAIDAIA